MAYNILIVDDSLPMRGILKKIIRISGFKAGEIFEAANGKDALDVANRKWCDIVLTDYNMPVMNGLDFLVELKKNDLYRDVPVIVVTTEGSQRMIERFMENGACGYVKKPFAPEAIKEKLNKVMGETADEPGFDESDEGLDF